MADSETEDERVNLQSSSIVRSLRTVGLCTLASRVLGMARDMLMAAVFGAGTTLDVFIVAFRIPNLTRQLFGEGAMTAAFLPIFIRERKKGDDVARETTTAVAVALSSLLTAGVVVAEAFIACVLYIGEWSESVTLLLQLLAILLPYVLFICLAALASAALHAMREFLWPALVPVILNIVWLTVTAIAVTTLNDDSSRVRLVAAGLTVAGVLQLWLPYFVLSRLGMNYISSWRRAWPKVAELLQNMLPIVAGVAVIQLNSALDSVMAWGLSSTDTSGPAPLASIGLPTLLESGTTTALYLGQRMYQFPVGVFGMALGTVLYPLLTEHAQRGELDRLREDLTKGIRLVIAIALPASAGLVVVATPLTRLLFEHGQFNAGDSKLAAQMIAMYGAGVWSIIGVSILNRAFYAMGDRNTPVRLGLLALVLNFGLNILLVTALGGIGIALGSVLATTFQLFGSVIRFHRTHVRFDWHEVWRTLWQSITATTIMIASCIIVSSSIPKSDNLAGHVLQLFAPVIVGAASYLTAARLMRMKELSEITNRETDVL